MPKLQKVGRVQDDPDGRNHLYSPPSNSLHPPDTVFCCLFGGRT
jgi:hypothetical protein